MKITEKTKIFKNNNGNYSTSVSNKKEDGTYENMYIAVNFKKGIEIENNTEINIKNGFLSFYKTKEGLEKPKIVVMEFETIKKETTDKEITNEFSNISDDDLPF